MAANGRKNTKDKKDDVKILSEELREGKYHRVYLFFGEESYLSVQYRQSLINALQLDSGSMNLNIHRDSTISFDQVRDEVLTMPFFSDYRLVIVENTNLFAAGASEKDVDNMLSCVSEIPESTVLLFMEDKVDKRSRLYKAVKKYGSAVEFTHPSEELLRRWILKLLSDRQIKTGGKALERFMLLAGDDMSFVKCELDKLAAYVGDGGILTEKAVDELVSARLENRIFDMIEAAAMRDRKKALDLYGDLLQLREAPLKILALLARQFRLLLQTRSMMDEGKGIAQIGTALEIRYDSIVRKYVSQARLFSAGQLRQALEDCGRMDEHIKTGRIDQETGVELLLVKFSGGTS